MRHVRSVLSVLAIIALALPLSGCNGCGLESEPVLELKSPLWLRTQPVMQPNGYAIRERVQTRLVEVPAVREYQYAPAPSAVGPCVDGPTYSPPPVPGDPSIPDSIPAIRR